MPSLFQNRYVKYGVIATGSLLVLFVLLIVFAVISNLSSSSLGLHDEMYYATSEPAFTNSLSAPKSFRADYDDGIMMGADMAMEQDAMYYPGPTPLPDGYTSGLESYETTNYAVSGKVKEFDRFCDELTTLKADADIHFKSLNESTNYCRATFYVADSKVESTLNSLAGYKGIEYTRDTSSVTRHKQNLESQISILQKQLARTESSLTAAEAQLDRLNELFLTSNDVTKLSAEVTNSLRYIDQLTQKKINYLSQLDNYYQQAADLSERIDVTEFSVNVSRANPLYVGKYEGQWERAWEDLKDTYHQTLINLTTIFLAFLLFILQAIIYLLVVIVVLRGLWKFVKLLWQKW